MELGFVVVVREPMRLQSSKEFGGEERTCVIGGLEKMDMGPTIGVRVNGLRIDDAAVDRLILDFKSWIHVGSVVGCAVSWYCGSGVALTQMQFWTWTIIKLDNRNLGKHVRIPWADLGIRKCVTHVTGFYRLKGQDSMGRKESCVVVKVDQAREGIKRNVQQPRPLYSGSLLRIVRYSVQIWE